jgi:nucleoside-triphosphatase THEP1
MGKDDNVQMMPTNDFEVRKKSKDFLNDMQNQGENFNLTTDQNTLLTMLGDHVDRQYAFRHQNAEKPQQLKILVLGGPGVGKTFVIERFTEMLEAAGLKSIVTAYTGVAVALHQNAETISSKFHMKILKKNDIKNTQLAQLDPIKDAAVLNKLNNDFGDLDYFIIDEVSMLDAVVFGQITQRLSEIMPKTSEDCGGINIILLGDFWQLPPVSGSPLYRDQLIQHAIIPTTRKVAENPTGPRFMGINLFESFQKYELNEYVRSSKDEQHTNFIKGMRSSSGKCGITHDLIHYLAQKQSNNSYIHRHMFFIIVN